MKMRKQPRFKASGLTKGEQVVMHTCREASNPKYAGKVWTTTSEPWDLCGSEVIKLEGFSGGFATEYLKRV
jgi:hypothetical protein